MDRITVSVITFAIGGLALAGTYWKPILAWAKDRFVKTADESSWRSDMEHCAALLVTLRAREDPEAGEAVKAIEDIVIPAVTRGIGGGHGN